MIPNYITFLAYSIMTNALLVSSCNRPVDVASENLSNQATEIAVDSTKSVAYFASGCFWCVEAVFESVTGVDEAISGYSGGTAKDAHYEIVGSGATNHAESVMVIYDAKVVDYNTLLKVFFGSHDPTTLNRQGPDAGRQYRSVIFYKNADEKSKAENYINALYENGTFKKGSITTELSQFDKFYAAEDYHQNYEKNNPNQPYVRSVSIPRLNKFKKAFPELLKEESKLH